MILASWWDIRLEIEQEITWAFDSFGWVLILTDFKTLSPIDLTESFGSGDVVWLGQWIFYVVIYIFIEFFLKLGKTNFEIFNLNLQKALCFLDCGKSTLWSFVACVSDLIDLFKIRIDSLRIKLWVKIFDNAFLWFFVLDHIKDWLKNRRQIFFNLVILFNGPLDCVIEFLHIKQIATLMNWVSYCLTMLKMSFLTLGLYFSSIYTSIC